MNIPLDPIRKRIVKAVEDRGLDWRKLSLQLNRNHAYLQQYIRRGIPAELKEKERRALSKILDIPERDLGGPSDNRPIMVDNFTNVSEFWVRAAAGGGAIVAKENKRRDWPFPTEYLRDELGLDRSNLAIIEVHGDSMEPTLRTGDRVMVNMNDREISQPGIFVLYDQNGTAIKRVENVPYSNPPMIVIKSDNPAHGEYQVPGELVEIVGRVVWAAKRL